MNADEILEAVVTGLKDELGSGFGAIADFVQRQGQMLAKQAERIGKSRIEGDLADDDDFYEWLLEGLAKDTANMARAVAGLTVLTIEKAWNAIANALWGGLSAILTAAGLPAALIPATPPRI